MQQMVIDMSLFPKKQCLNSLRYSIMLKLVGYLFSSIYAKFYIVSEVLFVYMPKITRDS